MSAQADNVVISSLPSYFVDLALGTLSYAKSSVATRVNSYKELAVSTTETAVKAASETAVKAREVLLDNYNPAKYENSLTRTLVSGNVASISAGKTAVLGVASAAKDAAVSKVVETRNAAVNKVVETKNAAITRALQTKDAAVDKALHAKDAVLAHPLVVATHNLVASNPYGAYAIRTAQAGIKTADEITTSTLSRVYALQQGAVTKFVEIKDGVITRVFEVKDGAISYVVELKNGAVSRVTAIKDGAIAKVVEVKNTAIARATTLAAPAGELAFSYAVKGAVIARAVADKGVAIAQSTAVGTYAIATGQKVLAQPLVQTAIAKGLDTATAVFNYALSYSIVSSTYAVSEDLVKKVLAASAPAAATTNGKQNGHH